MLAFIQKYAMYGLGILLAIMVATAGVQTIRLKDSQLEFAKHLEKDTAATANAIAQAKALGERVTTAVNDAATQYEKGKSDGQEMQRALSVGLDAGTVRVRTVWKCPAGRVDVPQNATAPVESGAAEHERNESAVRIIGAAHDCDAQVEGLIDAYNAAAKLINGG